MKKIFFLTFIFIPFYLLAQLPDQDKDALEVLDRMADKVKSMDAVDAKFTYTMVDKKEDEEFSNEGSFILKGDKYKLNLLGTQVFYDGKTMWNYLDEVNEVNITEPTEEETEVFFTNPTKLFTMYKEDFKLKYVGESTIKNIAVHEIDLYPRDIETPYFRIKFYVDKSKNTPKQIIASTKNGVTYTVDFDVFKEKTGVDKSYFVFNTKKHKDVEVIDFRE